MDRVRSSTRLAAPSGRKKPPKKDTKQPKEVSIPSPPKSPPWGGGNLTHEFLVHVTRGGKIFEISCRKNKVLSWRNNIEKDIGQVLQYPVVFRSAVDGITAANDELKQAFGTTDFGDIAREILKKGDIHLLKNDKQDKVDTLLKNISRRISSQYVRERNNGPLQVDEIESALKKIEYPVNLMKTALEQADDAMKAIRHLLPTVKVGGMRVKVTLGGRDRELLGSRIKLWTGQIESETKPDDDTLEIICQVVPPDYARIQALMECAAQPETTMDIIGVKNWSPTQ